MGREGRNEKRGEGRRKRGRREKNERRRESRVGEGGGRKSGRKVEGGKGRWKEPLEEGGEVGERRWWKE